MLAVLQRLLYKFHVSVEVEDREGLLKDEIHFGYFKMLVKTTACYPNSLCYVCCSVMVHMVLCKIKTHVTKVLRLHFCNTQKGYDGSIVRYQDRVCLSIHTHDDSCWDAPLPSCFSHIFTA